jgi:hypothetical protein
MAEKRIVQTHDEIIKPLPKRDDLLSALDDAKHGRRVWRDLFDDGPETEYGWRWAPR